MAAPSTGKRRRSTRRSWTRWTTLQLVLWWWTKQQTPTGGSCWAFSFHPDARPNLLLRVLTPPSASLNTAASRSHATALTITSSITPFHPKPLLSSSSSSSTQLLGCSIELVEPETQCPVVLIGCFHGSQSSAADVEAVLLQQQQHQPTTTTTINTNHPQQTTVLVLELCASRFADLRKDHVWVDALVLPNDNPPNPQPTTYDQQQDDETNMVVPERRRVVGFPEPQQQQPVPRQTTTTTKQQQQPKQQPWIQRYQRMIQTTAQSRGWSTAAAAAVLGGISGLQTALSNLEPGLEFVTATQIASRHNMDLVLADQEVETTLYQLGQLPRTAVELWRDCVRYGWDDTFGREWQALVTALMGSGGADPEVPSVTLGAFLTRSDAAVRDLLRLTVIPLLVLQLGNVVLTQGVGRVLQQLVVMMTTTTSPSVVVPRDVASTTASEWWTTTAASNVVDTVVAADWASSSSCVPIVTAAAQVLICVAGCLTIALPATRVVLRERDDRLAEGIRAACRHCRSSNGGGGGGGRVVAVLGLLHVNGVAQRLRQTATRVDYDTSDMGDNEDGNS